MGGSSKSSKTTQTNSPPAWAQPLFSTSANDAMKLYKSGAGGNTYLGNTVAPLSQQTKQGINALSGAGQNLPNYTNLEAMAGDPTAAKQYLGDYASGKFLQEGNPYYRQRLDREIGDANDLIQSRFSGSGRYGSGANQNVIADNTSNMLLSGLEQDYNRQQANQLTAVGMMDAANAQQIQNMLNVGQTGFQNRLTGADAQIKAGGMLDQQAQRKLSDEVNKFYALDNEDWTRLGMLQAAAAGSAGNYGTQVATTRQPMNLSPLLSLFAGK